MKRKYFADQPTDPHLLEAIVAGHQSLTAGLDYRKGRTVAALTKVAMHPNSDRAWWEYDIAQEEEQRQRDALKDFESKHNIIGGAVVIVAA